MTWFKPIRLRNFLLMIRRKIPPGQNPWWDAEVVPEDHSLIDQVGAQGAQGAPAPCGCEGIVTEGEDASMLRQSFDQVIILHDLDFFVPTDSTKQFSS